MTAVKHFTLTPETCYLKLRFDVKGESVDFTGALVQSFITTSIKSLHGKIGASAYKVSVLKIYDHQSRWVNGDSIPENKSSNHDDTNGNNNNNNHNASADIDDDGCGDAPPLTCLVCTKASTVVPVRAALTFANCYQGVPCRVSVIAVSSSLASMAGK